MFPFVSLEMTSCDAHSVPTVVLRYCMNIFLRWTHVILRPQIIKERTTAIRDVVMTASYYQQNEWQQTKMMLSSFLFDHYHRPNVPSYHGRTAHQCEVWRNDNSPQPINFRSGFKRKTRHYAAKNIVDHILHDHPSSLQWLPRILNLSTIGTITKCPPSFDIYCCYGDKIGISANASFHWRHRCLRSRLQHQLC